MTGALLSLVESCNNNMVKPNVVIVNQECLLMFAREEQSAVFKVKGSSLPCIFRKFAIFSLGQEILKIPCVNLKIFTSRSPWQMFIKI